MAVFLVLATRGVQGAKKLPGEAFQGIVGSDRWSAYNWLDPRKRQLCWVGLQGVEPTNYHAEPCLRRAVLWRRRSFGTQSSEGSLFVARILTAVTTLRQQKRDVLDNLTEACAAAIRGDKAPSLLPSPQTT